MLPRPPVVGDLASRSISKSRTQPANPQRKDSGHVRAAAAPSRFSRAATTYNKLELAHIQPTHAVDSVSGAEDALATFCALHNITCTTAASHLSSTEASDGSSPRHATSPGSSGSSSEADLSALLGVTCAPGTTIINIGSIPIAVPLVAIPVPADQAPAEEADTAATAAPAAGGTSAVEDPVAGCEPAGPSPTGSPATAATTDQPVDSAAEGAPLPAPSLSAGAGRMVERRVRPASKLKATSAEFYPKAYQAAASASAAAAVAAAPFVLAVASPSQQQAGGPSAPTTVPTQAQAVPAIPVAGVEAAPAHSGMAGPVAAAAAASGDVAPSSREQKAPCSEPSPSSSIAPPSPVLHLPLRSTSIAESSSGSSSRALSVVGSTSGSSSLRHKPLHSTNTVTVSAHSSVKDAAGGLAKVLSKRGACQLLALHRKPQDNPAAATHLGAKTLAVARFYINTRMAAAGTAGVSAAAALLGLQEGEHGPVAAAAGVSSSSTGGEGKEEVLFVPYHYKGLSEGSAGPHQQQQSAADMDAFGFVVSTTPADQLPIKLPSPVGPPQSMVAAHYQSNQQQQQQQQEGGVTEAGAPLLKASGATDVNRLSNALIHHLMARGHAALQLAGAAACHVAMQALVKARLRLERKFNCGLVAAASFAAEDTSSALGRSTVFLRLDVLRCGRDMGLMGPGAAGALAAASHTAWDL